MQATLKIGLIGDGFGPGTGPATYAEALRDGLGRHHLICPVDGACRELDLVHVIDAKRVDLKLLGLLRPPVVLDFHDDYWTRSPDYPAPDRFLRRIRRLQLRAHHRAALRHAAAVIVHSRSVADALAPEVEELALPRPPKIFVAMYGLSPTSETPAAHRRTDDPLILLAGRDLFRKGIATLIAAMPLVRQKVPAARALAVGREYPHTRLWARLIAGGAVDFLPHQSSEEMRALYRRASVVVLPSFQEAFGLTLIEAMAAGTPVVGSRVGGIPEAVEDGVSGLLHRSGDPADLAEKILRVLSDQSLAGELIAGGSARARGFSVPAMIEAVEAAYRHTLESA